MGGLIPKRLVQGNVVVNIHFSPAPWKTDPNNLDPKLDELGKQIKTFHKAGNEVVIVGVSGYASLGLNGYAENKAKVSKVVSICGRLKVGQGEFPPLELSAKNSRAFYDSVCLAEEHAKHFTPQDRAKFMTISSKWDEIVPEGTSILEGANNTEIPVPEHVLAIAAALTVYRKRWLDFILKGS